MNQKAQNLMIYKLLIINKIKSNLIFRNSGFANPLLRKNGFLV